MSYIFQLRRANLSGTGDTFRLCEILYIIFLHKLQRSEAPGYSFRIHQSGACVVQLLLACRCGTVHRGEAAGDARVFGSGLRVAPIA